MYWTRNLSFFTDLYLFNEPFFYICKRIVDNLILALQKESCVEAKAFQLWGESLAVLQPPQGLCSTLKLLTIHRAQVLAKLELFGTHKQAHFQNKIKYSDFWLLLLHKGTVEINQSPFKGSVLPVDLNYGLIIIYYLRCQTPPVSSCVIVLSFHPTPAAGFLGWVRKMF